MEYLVTSINSILLGLLILSPIFLIVILCRYRVKRIFTIYFLISLFLHGLLFWIFAWWLDKSDMMLLEQHGYNWEGWNETERKKRPDNASLVMREVLCF